MALFWHRRDLRHGDNHGLSAAGADGAVLPVFVLDPDVLAHASPPRVTVLLDALAALRAAYRDRGGDLVVRRGDPADVLPALADEHDEGRVVWNDDYSGLARERDDRVEAALEAAGIGAERYGDALIHEPGSVLTNAGTPYKVYTPFADRWRERPVPAPFEPPDAVRDEAWGELPTRSALGVDEPAAELPAVGPAAARERLDAFLDGPIYRYAADRDYPAREGTSRLSVDLRFGTIGIRAVWEAIDEALDGADGDGERESVEAFRAQLIWREFYAHVLAAEPRTVSESYRDYGHEIAWRDDPEWLQAWKAGETGYPIVDAGMRQLAAEAWLHNRVRMIVASFLTKDLLVDWRRGYAHFRERLVDHDPANDAGGWQWAASTGVDAQPYFRVFNPTTQGERYDPEAAYVTRYVPELADAPADEIHAWPAIDPERREAIAPDYPAPIVDHAEARERAIAAFEAARDRAEADVNEDEGMT